MTLLITYVLLTLGISFIYSLLEATLLEPLVWGSKQITRLIAPAGQRDTSMQRQEFLAMARMGEEPGSLGVRESQFVHHLIQLHAMKTWDIMTTRPVIFALP